MSDWQKGDLALCVKTPNCVSALVRAGGLYTVSKVSGFRDVLGEIGLAFEGMSLPHINGHDPYCAASRFRKVTPPKADQFDREVIEQMTGKPVEVV